MKLKFFLFSLVLLYICTLSNGLLSLVSDLKKQVTNWWPSISFPPVPYWVLLFYSVRLPTNWFFLGYKKQTNVRARDEFFGDSSWSIFNENAFLPSLTEGFFLTLAHAALMNRSTNWRTSRRAVKSVGGENILNAAVPTSAEMSRWAIWTSIRKREFLMRWKKKLGPLWLIVSLLNILLSHLTTSFLNKYFLWNSWNRYNSVWRGQEFKVSFNWCTWTTLISIEIRKPSEIRSTLDKK